MSKSRGHKVKGLQPDRQESDLFWMSLEEAQQAISDKYDFLVDRYERDEPKDHLIR